MHADRQADSPKQTEADTDRFRPTDTWVQPITQRQKQAERLSSYALYSNPIRMVDFSCDCEQISSCSLHFRPLQSLIPVILTAKFINLPINLFSPLPIHLSVCFFIDIFFLLIYLSVHLFVYLFISIFLNLLIYSSFLFSIFGLFISLSIYLIIVLIITCIINSVAGPWNN